MTRILQIGLLFAIIIPFGMAVRWGVHALPEYWRDMSFAGLVGFGLCYALWRWDDRIRQRAEGDKR